METHKPTISLVLGEDLLKAIEDYRFRLRFGSRLAAIRALLELGLAAAKVKDKERTRTKENSKECK